MKNEGYRVTLAIKAFEGWDKASYWVNPESVRNNSHLLAILESVIPNPYRSMQVLGVEVAGPKANDIKVAGFGQLA